ncbi:DUF3054 domain-containing protein [Corynebacterium pseudotuberculosis]|uniref:DUF3054 family protein n=1 Tax=Corynebacterium pseudotuberculosis 258 TaxID=1168865 RepID=A0AAU8PPV0_CORPS|nr:DUF3054 domain-containing protein [Corynebacterium pseudotuberculosis]AEQ07474.1 DUF3054 family protein [Corynebacterium pseudotuberculosis CIP 52.97]AFB73284.1 DUF3054 family protein [Corynebacterium pseudotuberculosis 316]AFH91734.1 DUF3054 family protein [Corynebacterium pseudotuberculosis 31]AFK17582.1 DUF3054 family protein [Corynebacterium pseudotuberculosis 258]AKS14293.1 Hypothetical protein CpE19_1957 [Corynebacterium pseudotuberculosis]
MKYFCYDVIAVLAFAVLARAAHGGLGIFQILDTWWPFLIGTALGWLLIRAQNPLSLRHGVVVWIATAAAGLLVWGIRHGQVPHWSFMIVATVMSGILLLGWRAVAGKIKHSQSNT